ncbi:Oidioi.mRNA.OKI2018_I69.chr2.g4373.t1.cds [Oikopleura dioica]|uniref:Oidioi.mRNA.OKI2018_I69.chr2.g4373.t1.cds n=1 Tax=Oikopleura dioica TaxID=34765 RepID=A0ABN7T3R4_OIKDI|nr:Oidioi.mRNA.OKI2018_I69.chr2.g4373.t1.cds [Oikopleura dioica]
MEGSRDSFLTSDEAKQKREKMKASTVNAVSLFLGMIEMLLFANIFYGFPFIQKIFEEEKVYMNEVCSPDDIVNGTYCKEAKLEIGKIWTYGVVFSCTGPLVFGTLVNAIGTSWTRLIAGGSATVGLLLMSFYKTYSALLLPGVILVAFPSIAWIMLNTFISPVYKKITVILIVIIPGLINSSATSMLIAKKLYESSNGEIGLETVFSLLCILSILIHIRTLFLMPSRPIPKNIHDNYNLFKESLVMSFCKSTVKTEKMEKPKRPSASSHLKFCKTGAFLVYLVYYTIVTFRINTIRGWMTTWIKHAYEGVKTNCSTEECVAEVDGTISFLIDINGYAYFSLALIPLIPAFIIKAIGNSYPEGYKFGELRAKLGGMIFMMTFCAGVSLLCSFLMTLTVSSADSYILAISNIALSVFIVPLHYSTPWLLLFSYFPPQFVQFLYALMTIPSILVSFLNTPLYNMILGEEDSINFGPVSLYLGLCSALTWICSVYLWFDSRKLIKKKEEEEKNTLYSPEKNLIDSNRDDEVVKA